MSTQKKEREDPSTTSSAYRIMAPRWAKINALLGGTETMREAGRALLPQHTEESDDAWNERMLTATLFNMTELTLKSWVGRPFSDPTRLNEDVPEEIVKLSKNIDLQGNNIDVFARNWFEQGLAKALCHVLVEFPRIDKENGRRTLADDRKEGIRPYWVLIEPEDLFFASVEIIDGVETLTHVRIAERELIRDGFAEKVVERIRILEPGKGWLYEKQQIGKSKRWQWVQVDEWESDLPIVPLVTFYADREGPMMGKPPIMDLADLNVRHWQSNSDQINILTVTRFPILACSGGTDDAGKLKIGPNRWLHSSDPQGRWYYVEHAGKAIEAGRRDLLDLEEQMANYGAEFLRKKPGALTATARALDSAEATSPLQDVSIRFMGAAARVLDLTAQWLKLKDGGTLRVALDFGPENVSQEDLRTLTEARRLGDLSRTAWLQELQRRGLLSDAFDFEKNEAELEDEALDLSAKGVPPELEEAQGEDDDKDKDKDKDNEEE